MPASLDSLAAGLSGLLSLGELAVARLDPNVLAARDPNRAAHCTADFRAALVTDPGLAPGRAAYVRPMPSDAPLVRAVNVVPSYSGEPITPVTVAFTSAADAVTEGNVIPEATMTYTVGSPVKAPTIAHSVPLTAQAAGHQDTLRADVDGMLAGGLLAKVDQSIAAALLAADGDMVAHAFDTDLATTVRTAIAAAQSAFLELGAGEVTVALSPDDHAALDLAVGAGLAEWPARIVSSPSLPDGVAYVGRMGVAVQLYATDIELAGGFVGDQFIRNRMTVRAAVDALPHVTAPAAIVAATLTAP